MFQSVSQRAAYSYLQALGSLKTYLPQDLAPAQAAEFSTAQSNLHGFFQAFYANLFENPLQFGLPAEADICITGSEPNQKDFKQEVTKKMKKPRERIAQGLAFLRLAGEKGELRGQTLSLLEEEYTAFLKANRACKAFLEGLKQTGLTLSATESGIVLSSERFPAMMPALLSLARACADNPDANLAALNFARCDFRALDPLYRPTALDLYSIFPPADFQIAARLHEFFSGLDYKPIIAIYPNIGWEVQYQGRRQVKSTPFLRIQYSDRHQNPLYIDLKLASAGRIIPLLYQQPRRLQEDFFHRSTACGDCSWCKNKTILGPSYFEFEGVQKKVCWYTMGEMGEMNEEKVALIEEYARMHEQLAGLAG